MEHPLYPHLYSADRRLDVNDLEVRTCIKALVTGSYVEDKPT